ncbi:hypothetical protein DNTS_035302 [Danionella cerebrum]|uniref:Interleukin n=1 Tax=Danionella cerebrum TaxID=2873325 RepID=A0A553QC17_9TELE|nr:hypothetical protein DNTS_035302 [Danionella translucida]
MDAKQGLLIWCVFLMIPAMSCRPAHAKCNIVPLVNHTKRELNILLSEYLLSNGNEIQPWMKTLPELDLNLVSAKEKHLKVPCGLAYMHKALQEVHKHQKNLLPSKHPVLVKFETVITKVNHCSKCVASNFGSCTNTTDLGFVPFWTYERKQWGRTVLENSVAFLSELKNILEDKHPNQTNA